MEHALGLALRGIQAGPDTGSTLSTVKGGVYGFLYQLPPLVTVSGP